jgi:hypothetical protein
MRLVGVIAQPPMQWVQGVLSLGVKRPGREADPSSPSSAVVKECVQLYPHSPITPLWRGAPLKISTGTTLLLLKRDWVGRRGMSNSRQLYIFL